MRREVGIPECSNHADGYNSYWVDTGAQQVADNMNLAARMEGGTQCAVVG